MTTEHQTPAADFGRIAAIFSCVAFNAGILATTIIALPILLTTELGANYAETSLFLVAGIISATLASQWIGRWSDSGVSRRTVGNMSALAGIIAYTAMAGADSYLLLLLIFVTVHAISSSLSPQLFALIFVMAPSHVPLSRAIFSLGFAIGAPIGGYSIAILGSSNTFLIIALLFALNIPVLFWSAPGRPDSTSPDEVQTEKPDEVPVRAYIDLVLVLFGLHLLLSVPNFAIPLRILELGGSEIHVGMAFSVTAIIEIPIIAMAGKFRTWFTSRQIFSGVAAGMIMFFIALFLARTPGTFIAATVLNGISGGIMLGYGLVIMLDRLSDYPGFASALYHNLLRIAFALGFFIAGGIAQFFGFPALFCAAAALAALLFAGILLTSAGSGNPRE